MLLNHITDENILFYENITTTFLDNQDLTLIFSKLTMIISYFQHKTVKLRKSKPTYSLDFKHPKTVQKALNRFCWVLL